MTDTLYPKPSLNPQKAQALSDTEDGWFYEGKGGITVVAVKNGVTTQARIQWWRLMKSAVRCGWKVRRTDD